MYRVLIVDDEAAHRKGMMQLLNRMKPEYLLLEARDGNLAELILGTVDIDIILTDIRMPNKDGLEFLTDLYEAGNRAKVIIVSGYGHFSYAKEAMSKGAFDFLLKPIDPEELEQVLERAEMSLETEIFYGWYRTDGYKRIGEVNDMNFGTMLGNACILDHGRSRAVNAENPGGKKGKGGMAASHLGTSRKGAPCIPKIEPGETAVLADINGAGVIEHIWITVTDKTSDRNPFVLRDLVLRIYWDREETPSVECPLGDFFCCGFGTACSVTSMPIVVIPNRGMNSYWSMPFASHARITIENQNEEAIPAFFYQIDYCEYDQIPEDAAYFHAQWRRQPITEKGKDYVVLDGVKGRGRYVGTYLALTALERYWWGEGEMKFFVDGDKEYPTICGTGTEDYFGGAWSFAEYDTFGAMREVTYNTPFMGYPYYSSVDETVKHPCHNDDAPVMRGFYRWHLPDPIRFEEDLKVTLQQIGVSHQGLFERQDDVATVAYWYQQEPHEAFITIPDREERWPR